MDTSFGEYGRVVHGVPTEELMAAVQRFSLPDSGMVYSPREDDLHAVLSFTPWGARLFADMPYQLGYCAGSNQSADTLVRHGGSAFICGQSDFALAVRHRWEQSTKRFVIPAQTLVEIYGDTLRSAPLGEGFRVLALLPYATNTEWRGEDGIIARNTWQERRI
ncbi:MAG: DUF4867 family protein [Clostridia bacterium]|nr:DUF4867 family protein [Clostridia bacterium]